MPIHRTLKNVVKNYTLAEVKVREATSNDPWGPSTSLMSEIADLTFNMMALAEIMNMIWKRLSDQGKNWRHVYKSLVLLDYLLKTGSERVTQQSRENIHTLQSLSNFQYLEDGKDHGTNIREKSKQITALLNDDERLKNERIKALTAKERFAQNTGLGSGVRKNSATKISHSTSDRYLYASSSQAGAATLNSELEAVRPSSFGEEDLQLQLALAMSKEEHDEELKRRKGDEMKLQMAIEESKKISQTVPAGGGETHATGDLFALDAATMGPSKITPSQTWDGNLSGAAADPWGTLVAAKPTPGQNDPWGLPAPAVQPVLADPWSSTHGSSSVSARKGAFASPWGDPTPQSSGVAPSNGAVATANATVGMDNEFDLLSTRYKAPSAVTNVSAGGASSQSGEMTFDLLGGDDPWNGGEIGSSNKNERKKTAEDFLGANANLVNLNDLVTPRPPPSTILNPFGAPAPRAPAANLFAARALEEGKNRQVPIGQMSGSSLTAAPGYAAPSLGFASSSSTVMPAQMQPFPDWSLGASIAFQQTALLPPQSSYPQSKNPFQ